jgi:2-C-methyl-D-erythritol 4-phosphate cytidylyltransferase
VTVVRDVGVVIVAGGSGTRAAGSSSATRHPDAGEVSRGPASNPSELKQFRWVAGKPALLHSLQAFMARADVVSVVCVLPRDYAADPPPWIFQCDVDRLMIAPGGRTRTESVANGLDDLPDEAKIVLIHDAARPLVGDDTIDRVVSAVRSGTSAIAALPVVDTLKEVDESGRITRTVERERLWRAQTPQGFPREVIVRAHRDAKAQRISATDDAALCERLGIPVLVVRGSERAMKITEEPDFARAEALFTLPE